MVTSAYPVLSVGAATFLDQTLARGVRLALIFVNLARVACWTCRTTYNLSRRVLLAFVSHSGRACNQVYSGHGESRYRKELCVRAKERLVSMTRVVVHWDLSCCALIKFAGTHDLVSGHRRECAPEGNHGVENSRFLVVAIGCFLIDN